MNMQPIPLEPIRQAVSAGEFGRAQLLWNECVANLAEQARNKSLTEARLHEIRQLVDWTRTVVLCERVRMTDQLNSLRVAGEYEQGAPAPHHRLFSTSF
jgi:hypothetical protein